MQILYDYYIQFILCIFTGYLIGSVSFSIVISRIYGAGDIRTLGSKNAGTTNVLRSIGVLPSLITLLCDVFKCTVAVLLAVAIFNIFTYNGMYDVTILQLCKYLSAFSCVLGHLYPCFFQFKGGKGVSSTAGAMLAIDWRVCVACVGIFIIVFFVKKIVSIASISAAVSLPIMVFVFSYFIDYVMSSGTQCTIQYVIISVIFSLAISVLLICKHKANLIRIKNGTEKKISIHK